MMNHTPTASTLTESFQNWYPKRITWDKQTPTLMWQYIGDAEFSDPFYLDTLSRSLCHIQKENPFKKTPLTILDELSEQLNFTSPDGFIFHMSRCGSTLVSNLLQRSSSNLVISEAIPLDGILRSHFNDVSITDEQRAAWFKTMVTLLGRQRHHQHTRYFIKLDCWHIAALPFIQALFPETPCLFLYRSPAEVLASHHKLAGNQMVPGLIEAEWYSNDTHSVTNMTQREYGIWVMEQILQLALSHHEGHELLLIDYAELPNAYAEQIAPFFNIPENEIERSSLNTVLTTHSKNRGETFHNDSRENQRISNTLYGNDELVLLNTLYSTLREVR